MMKESIFIALALLACVNLYSFHRLDTLKTEKATLETKLETLEQSNRDLTNQLLGSFAK